MADGAARWQRLEDIVQAALDRPAKERAAFLAEACGDDENLLREAVSLVEQDDRADGFLAKPIGELAANAMTYSPGTRPEASESRNLVGSRIGAYEIRSRIGAGGMGEVYRAHDHSLHRDVAIKVLPSAFLNDHERLTRFEREARLLASLNHRHIGAVYGLEGSGNLRGIVLELIDGETLETRLKRGAIPVAQALTLAVQIASALDHAHQHGVMHRDLKPANIMLTKDGAKLLDFGLAKWSRPRSGYVSASGSAAARPEGVESVTSEGTILGTLHYMAPEQLEGKKVDARADVFAFGAVLYEMLIGKRAFDGGSTAAVMAAVLNTQPTELDSVQRLASPGLERIVRKCLAKDPDDRWQTTRDLADELKWISNEVPRPSPSVLHHGVRRSGVNRWAALGAVVLGVALAGWAGWRISLRPSTPLAVTRFMFTLPEGQPFSALGARRHLIAMSPDGAQLVYVASSARLYLRSMSELDVRAIPGSEGFQNVSEPVFSPDGRSVAFFAFADQTIKRIAVTGGAAVTICPADPPFGISWGPDGIVFGQGRKGIMRVSPDGGTPEVLVRVKDGEEAQSPQVLPGGQHLLFTLGTGTATDRWDQAQIVVQSLTSEERTTLIDGGSDARYVPTGHIVYGLSGRVFAVAFDVQRLAVNGDPVPIVEGVRQASGGVTGAAHFSFSSTGSLIYIPGPVSTSLALLDIALADRKGGVEPLKLPPGPYLMPRVSPDGTRIAFGTDDGKEAIVWIYDLSGRTARRRLTFGGNNRFPIWSADGRHVAFQSDRDSDLAIFWQLADGGTAAAERLTKPDQGTSQVPESWSPEGDRFLFSVTKGADASLWTFSLQDRKAMPFDAVHSTNPIGAVFSPDGRWVAYSSTERGTTTIYVQPFPATGAKYQLLARGEDNPHMVVWSPDGKELFYDPRPGGFEAVSVTTQPTFAFGNPVALPQPLQLGPSAERRTFDITPGGKFVGLIPAGQTEFFTPIAPQIQVVLNWFEELKARLPTGAPAR